MPATARTVTCIATFSTIYMHHDMLASLHRLRLHFKNSEYHYLDVTLIIHALLLLPPPLFVSNNVKFVQNKSANEQTHEEIRLQSYFFNMTRLGNEKRVALSRCHIFNNMIK